MRTARDETPILALHVSRRSLNSIGTGGEHAQGAWVRAKAQAVGYRAAMRGALILVLLASACSGTPRTTTVEEAPLHVTEAAVLPLREGSQLPIVTVKIDGHDGLPFLVDSGASHSIVELERARELGLFVGPYSHGTTTRGSGGGSVAYDHYARAGRLVVGGVELNGARLPAIDTEVLRDLELVGILGQDLLRRLIVLFDSERAELHLLPAKQDVAEYLSANKIGAGKWVQVPLSMRPCPFLPLLLTATELEAEIEVDTGAATSSFPADVIAALDLTPTGTAQAQGIDGFYEEATYVLESFGFYGFELSLEIKRSPLEYGLLGMDVLGEFVFLIDGPAETLWLHHRAIDPQPNDE